MARLAAEEAKAACAQFPAEQQISEARLAIHETNKEALALISEIKGNQHSPASALRSGTSSLGTLVGGADSSGASPIARAISGQALQTDHVLG